MNTPPPDAPPPAAPPPAATQQPESSYLGYLPAIFRQTPLVGRFLLAFETMLTAPFWTSDSIPDTPPQGVQPPGLETTIGHVADYLDPATTRADFLPWLASWVALSLRADWDEQTRRDFIRQIVSLYKLRGTLQGMLKMLSLYTRESVKIWDGLDDEQPGEGPDHRWPPFFFEVQLTLTAPDEALLETKRQIARAIIDQEKPAHTYYALQFAIPTMRLVSPELSKRQNVDLLYPGRWNTPQQPKLTNNPSVLGTQIPVSQ
jgi:phage tail-like protein